MTCQLRAYELAAVTFFSLVPIPAALAQAVGQQPGFGCQDQLQWSHDRLAKFTAAIAHFEQEVGARQAPARQAEFLEFDAVIASVAQDVATRQGDALAMGESVLGDLRNMRDAYRAEVKETSANRPTGKVALVADDGNSVDKAEDAFWAKVNAYLDAVNADTATRQAVMQIRFTGD